MVKTIEDRKSQVDKYVSLLSCILADIEALTGLDMERDRIEIRSRVAHEGLSFLCKTMPRFYKAVLSAVEAKQFQPVVGFKTRRQGPLPQFLGGLVSVLFDGNGKLQNSDDCPYYTGYIGQLCTIMYKCEFPYTEKQEQERLEKFKVVDNDIERIGALSPDAVKTLDNAIALSLELHRQFDAASAMPKHGPGAVAGGEKGFDKFDFDFSETVDSYFPYEEWFTPRSLTRRWRYNIMPAMRGQQGSLFESLVYDRSVDFLLNGDVLQSSGPCICQGNDRMYFEARGIFVNKDSRGPRYISAERKEHMWLQQALGIELARYYQRHSLTAGHVNFSDQSINATLALESSKDGEFATLDMEDASDRVSLALARLILPVKLLRLLEACRSRTALLPDNTIWKLAKFAPMGSAVCFPIESIIFWILVVATIQRLTGWDAAQAAQHVYVYGDDIVVTRRFAREVIESVECFGLLFNKAKCFIDGPFRESCGCDAFGGVEITPVKLRRPFPKSRRDSAAIISHVETSNLLFFAGYWRAAEFLRDHVEGVYKPLPTVPISSGVLGFAYYRQGYRVPEVGTAAKKRSVKSAFGWSHEKQCVTFSGMEPFNAGLEEETSLQPRHSRALLANLCIRSERPQGFPDRVVKDHLRARGTKLKMGEALVKLRRCIRLLS
jgi:hypothetical protein